MTGIATNILCGQEAMITSLREQILANATILFPQLISKSVTLANTGVFNPLEMFQVIISSPSGTGYKAILVAGVGVAKQAVSCGPEAPCVAEALAALLKVTAEAMGWYTETLLGEIEHAEEGSESGGAMNLKMVEEGFHFAHVQRWAEGKKQGV